MNQTTTGYVIFAGALAATLGLLGAELAKLHTFGEMWTPLFIGTAFIHISTVAAAYIGGRITPIDPRVGGNRATDPK